MQEHVISAWHTLVPARDDRHGVLSPLLVALTVVTGLIDAFSYLELGRVFVANMTGNVVFLSFALGGAEGFIWWASLLGIVAFLLGARWGGFIGSRSRHHRGVHLLRAIVVQLGLVLAALIGSIFLPRPYTGVGLGVLILVLGVAMGLQNATARSLAVPDLTTTVLTLTMVGISADSSSVGGTGSRLGRRFVSIFAMFVGGLAGAAISIAGGGPIVLGIVAVLLVAIIAVLLPKRRATGPWTQRG